jgi:hypothetical protein
MEPGRSIGTVSALALPQDLRSPRTRQRPDSEGRGPSREMAVHSARRVDEMRSRWTVSAVALIGAVCTATACGNDESTDSGVGGGAGSTIDGGGAGTTGGGGGVGASTGGGGNFAPCSEWCSAPIPPDCTETLVDSYSCMPSCEQLLARVPDACAPAWNVMIGCTHDAITDCVRLSSGVCEDEYLEVVDCAAAEDPCFYDYGGLAWSREGVSASVDREACACEPPDGAAPGTACSEASECAELCCECDDVPREHGVRACVEGRCADAAVACAEAFSYEPALCEGEAELP